MILEDLTVDAGAFAARTGWAIKPEGACKGEICVPLPEHAHAATASWTSGSLAERLGMPLVADEPHTASGRSGPRRR